MNNFPFYRQLDSMDCGPSCLKMIAQFHGRYYSLETLRTKTEINIDGVSLLGLSQAAEGIGYRTVAALLTWNQLENQSLLPCIVHWDDNHFVVVYKIKKKKIWVADPSKGLIKYSKEEFLSYWIGKQNNSTTAKGTVLLLYPTPKLFEIQDEKKDKLNFSYLFKYLFAYKKLVIQLILGLLTSSILQLIFPFLTQSLVDIGINTHDLNFVTIILFAQLFLFLGQTGVDFIQSWILLHISTRVNVSILSDFLSKLMKLPIRYFEYKMTGDILQRMNDHHRIETFLTGQTLTTLFSSINFIVFSIILAYYNLVIFIIFIGASVLYIMWVVIFLKHRRKLDSKRFEIQSMAQNSVIQLIQGMQEIKLTNSSKIKRWQWENIQAQSFHFQIKNLTLSQYQEAGAVFLNQSKNIFITYFSALAVLNGDLSLGAMLAIQYIIGQLNSPILQLIGFVQALQDAKISLERLNEIHKQENEETTTKNFIYRLPEKKDISFKNISFTYPGAGNSPILKDFNLEIPEGKVTAIVGMSGSGKTTILKLLMKFYEVDKGEITIGNEIFSNLSHEMWRERSGSVMQNGFIFSDTIANNIAVGEEHPDETKLNYAANISNIQEFITSLPLGFNTTIGAGGNGISEGQRQRILIARVVYRNPEFLFFDEATNSLDSNNESCILKNLQDFFKSRTVVIVAHRLSTIKNADNIIVIGKGKILEQGNHNSLVKLKGHYHTLILNQLELDY